jgi:cytochrome c553
MTLLLPCDGQLPDGASAGGSMALVIKNTSRLSENDRAAMAAYIKSLPPVDGPTHPKNDR